MIDSEQRVLIAAIATAPAADPTPWLAYADWLDARNDRRGDVIRQSIACDARTNGALQERERQLSPLYGEDLMSPRLRAQARHWRFVWWRGFIRNASLHWHEDDPPSQETVEALLDDPHVSRLSLSLVDRYHLAALFQPPETRAQHTRRRNEATRPLWWALLARSRPTVRHLHVWGLDHVGIARLDQLPALERLELDGDEAITEIGHPNLQELHCSSQPIATAAKIDLPELEFLEWSDGRPPSSLLDHPPPKLATLLVRRETDMDAIAGSALASQIRVIYADVRDVRGSLVLNRFPVLQRLVVSAPARVRDELRRELGVEIADDFPAPDTMVEIDKIDPL